MSAMETTTVPSVPLAIVGMACRFPGADNLDAFWSLLVDGRCAIGPLPPDRLYRATEFAEAKDAFGKTYCSLGGVVPLRPVDRNVLPVEDEVLARFDVGHQTMCEVAAAACRHAGYNPLALPLRETGVYVGNSSGGSELEYRLAYHRHAPALAALLTETPGWEQLPPATRTAVTRELVESVRLDHPSRRQAGVVGVSPHVAATMIAELFGLSGPAMAIDAACASSMIALAMASLALAAGTIDMALVAGSAYRKLYEWAAISRAGSMSKRGCCPFDADADGIICSDGFGAVLVKTLSRAVSDGDRILGVVRSVGISSDGRGKGFWAPRKEGQVAAIRRAYMGGVDPSCLQYIEAHATSTQLGDATEIESLDEAIGGALPEKIAVASVKGNVGHTLEAAGMAGLIKTVLAMQHGVIPPAANIRTPNPAIPWERVPFFVPGRAQEWCAAGEPYLRRAGIDSFGIGGLNVHVVLDQSAESAEGLHSPTRRLRSSSTQLSSTEPSPELRDVSPAQPVSAKQETKKPARTKPRPSSSSQAVHRAAATSIVPDVRKSEPAAVVGMSCILPGAESPAALWDLLQSGRDAKRRIPSERWNAEALCGSLAEAPRGGFVTGYEFDWKKFRIPPKQLATANPLQFMLLDAAARALDDAGYENKSFDRKRAAAVVGSIFHSDFTVECWYGVWMNDFGKRLSQLLGRHGCPPQRVQSIATNYSRLLAERRPGALDETGSVSSSTLASRIAKQLDLMGGAFAVDAADASAAAALAGAIDLLNSKSCDTVLCAAGQRSMDVTVFDEYGIHSPSGVNLAGVPAEGVVCVVLKRLSDARRDGDRICGILHASALAAGPSAERAAETARRRATAAACIDPQAAGMVETAEFGPIASGQARGTRDGWPASVLRLLPPTRQIGDLQGGNALLMLIEALLAIEHGSMPRHLLLGDCSAGAAANSQPAENVPVYASTAAGSCLAALELVTGRGFHSPQAGLACEILLEAGDELPRSPLHTPVKTKQFAETKGTQLSETIRGSSTGSAERPIPQIAEFDATQQRKERRRRQAQQRGAQQIKVSPASAESAATAATPNAEHVPSAKSSKTTTRPAATAQPELAAQQVGSVSAPDDGRTMKRFVMSTVPSALPADAPKVPEFKGPVLLLGSNPTARALKQRLADIGATVHELPIKRDPQAAVAALERLWQSGPLPHLMLLTARDDNAAVELGDASTWSRRRQQGVMLPWLVCQRWFALVEEAGLLDGASIVAATALGGDFGFAGHSGAVEGGGLAGLLKSLHNETRRRLPVKIIDAPLRDPAKLVASEILGELAANSPEVEVGYIRGQRQVVRAVRQQAAELPRRTVKPGTVWLVTGGARGVTAEATRELARRFNLRLHLLGSSPMPDVPDAWRNLSPADTRQLRARIMREALKGGGESPLEAWRRVEKALEIDASLARYREANVEATYHACDVADIRSLGRVLEQIRDTDGPIEGIVHGAGSEVAGRFQKKKPHNVERVLGAKLTGTLALMALTEQDRPRYFVAFGSTSGRFGGYLQTDYSLANDMLAKIVNHYGDQHPECAAFSFHWTAWDEVGMAASPRGELILDTIGVKRMPVAEGVEHFIDELQVRSPDREILICDHPGGIHSDQPTMPTKEQLATYAACRELLVRAPLVDHAFFASAGKAVARATFDPTADPFLLSHLDNGVPLFPAVMGIELCAEVAAIVTGGKQPVELRDFTLINGLRMALAKPYRVAAHMALEDGNAKFCVTGEYYDKQGRLADPERRYQSGTLVLGDRTPVVPAPADFGPPPGEWTSVPYPDEWQTRSGHESGTVFYGPALRALQAVCYLPEGSAWGRIVVPPFDDLLGNRRGDEWRVAPAVLDAALLTCDLFAAHLHGSRQFPHGIERLWFGRQPREGEQCVSRTFFRGREDRYFLFDFWLFGDDGDVIYRCEGCRFVDIDYSIRRAVTRQPTAS